MEKSTKLILSIVVILIAVVGLILLFAGSGGEPLEAGGATGETEPLKIGSILPLTGDAASIGQNTREGIRLAVAEVNAAGGINGRPLEVLFEDGKCGPKEATNAANKLVNLDKVLIIFGGLCSSETIAAAPIAEEEQVVLFSMCSSNPDITHAGDYIFRDYPSDAFQGKKGAEIAFEELQSTNAAILYCLSDWCVGIKDVFGKTFESLGGTLVIEEGYEQTTKDLRTQLTKIREAKPDLVYFVGYTEASIIGLKQIKELGIDVPLLGADAWDDPKIAEEASEAAEGIMWTVPFAPLTDKFKAAMKAQTGSEELTICTPQAYDAVHIVADIMKRVGADSTKIKDELYKVKNYPGVSGTITLDSNGDLATASYVLKTIKNGKVVEE